MPTISHTDYEAEPHPDIPAMLADVHRFLYPTDVLPSDFGTLVSQIGIKLPMNIVFVLQLDPEVEKVATMAGVVAKLAVRHAVLGGSDTECIEIDRAMQAISSEALIDVDRLTSLVNARLAERDEEGEVFFDMDEIIGDFIEEPSRNTFRRVQNMFDKMLKQQAA